MTGSGVLSRSASAHTAVQVCIACMLVMGIDCDILPCDGTVDYNC